MSFCIKFSGIDVKKTNFGCQIPGDHDQPSFYFQSKGATDGHVIMLPTRQLPHSTICMIMFPNLKHYRVGWVNLRRFYYTEVCDKLICLTENAK